MRALILIVLVCSTSWGQGLYGDDLDDRTTGLAIGGHLYSYGIGFDVYYFKEVLPGWEVMGIVSAENIKENSEIRRRSLYNDQGGRDFIFDKKNYAYNLSATFGIQRQIFKLNNYNKLSMRAGLAVGPNLAIMKPYYIEVAVPINSTQAEVSIEPYDHTKHTFRDIVGRADFFEGSGDLTYTPGLRVRAFGMLNLAGSSLFIRSLHFGGTVDVFGSKLNILYQQADKNVFYSVYLGVLIGNAW